MNKALSTYHGVILNKVVEIPRYQPLLKIAFKSIFFKGKKHSELGGDKFLIFYSHRNSFRYDYDDIIDNLKITLPDKSYSYLEYSRVFSLMALISFTHCLCKGIYFSLKDSSSILGFLKNTFLYTRAIADIQYLNKLLNNTYFKYVVTFSDAHELDGICTYIAKVKNIVSITLQHGLYNITKCDIPENCVVKNMHSDYFCSWGPKTSQLITTYTDTVPIDLGSLRSSHQIFDKYNKEKIFTSGIKAIKVFLNADNFYSSNIGMLDVVQKYCYEFNIPYLIQYHPRNKKSLYGKYHVGRAIDEVRMSEPAGILTVVHSSGVIYELLSRSNFFLVFKDSKLPEFFHFDSITFSSYSDFYRMAESLSSTSYDLIQDEIIAKGSFLNNYKLFFAGVE
jgi:hypothetical protein